ncbi:hypothetical protein [Carboxylicivirga sp. RSCT41]|uniref:hypothetical protein n=1 Tax=Carboxylicivirga agarovorans TaxID=3417570 RepID=UPI003D334E1D
MALTKIHGVSKDDKKQLTRMFNCGPSLISMALNGKRKSEKAIKIRRAALTRFGGVELIVKPKEATNL